MTEKELHKIFCENIKKYRRQLDWSQVMLAKKTGLSVNFVNDIESGKKWTSPITMVKIANAFNIHAYELLKPPDLFPDNLNSILKKYTDNIHEAVEAAQAEFMKEQSSK